MAWLVLILQGGVSPETPPMKESLPSFCSDAPTLACKIRTAASARTIPENASSQFNGVKSRTGVFPYLFQIHLVYLKIMSKSSGISNTRHLFCARYIKHDATKARHAVFQPFSLVWICTNIQRSNWMAAENSERKTSSNFWPLYYT